MLRGIVLVLALAALLFPVAAWADTIVLDNGRLTLNVGSGTVNSQSLGASGLGFGASGFGNLGFSASSCGPCLPGSVYFPGAGGSGASFGYNIFVTASVPNCPTCFPSTFVNATGHGTATFSFVPDPPGRGWWLSSGVFDIQPIPEPATWILVPTAVGLAWLARKKRKANTEHAAHSPYGAV